MNATDQTVTLKELVPPFLEYGESLQYSVHTIARQKSALKEFIAWLEDRHHVETPDRLNVELLHEFQKHLSQRLTKEGMPLKPITMNTIIKGIRAWLAWMYDLGYVYRVLEKHLAYVREPRVLPTSVLTHAQVRKLIRKIDTNTGDGIRDRAAIELMYSSGIRIGELESLTLQDVNLDEAVARVVGKGKKERFVPIGKTAIKWMLSYIRGIRPFQARLAGSGHQTERVFLNPNGHPMHQRTLRNRVREYGRQLELDIDITPHTFRRSCTTELVKSNANLYHVKQLLGHESFETLKHYAKLNIADLRKTHSKCHPREREDSLS